MSESDLQFDSLLEYLKRTRGFDFSGYKRAGLIRRVEKRMSTVAAPDFSSYQDYLEVHPDEFGQLFNTILINVTSFFRDPPVWDYLRQHVIPKILAAKDPQDHIRVWSAGCATGEEAYSLATLLADAIGVDATCQRVKIYATDADEEALNIARVAVYPAPSLAALPEGIAARYFEKTNSNADNYSFNKDLRRCVIFGRHDLLQDAPISRVDLLVCRNALMYFNAEAQTKILTRFHFALADDGFLVLGKAETLLTRANLFSPIDLRRRIFSKVPKLELRDRLMILAQSGGYEPPALPALSADRIRDAAFDAAPVAQIIIDLEGALALANDRARNTFAISTRDIGRPISELDISYRPAELRSVVDKVHAERRPVSIKDIEWLPIGAGERAYLDLLATPLYDSAGTLVGVNTSYTDVTRHRHLQDEVHRSHQELEAAYEELQSTSEELETTNEELQSTVEELETTNEELQSTNEELETMNEELQSTNEEMQTTNDELRKRSTDLDQVNAFLNSILSSLHTAVIVVDRDLHIRAWNQRAEDLWGMRSEEVQGKQLMSLDIGITLERLLPLIRECLNGDGKCREMLLDATNRRGKTIHCKITATPLQGTETETRGVILLMEESPNQ
jgi:two-component system CheB/CheR fusion protein